MKTIAKAFNLDAETEYDEHHDFSNVVMFVSSIKKIGEFEEEVTADQKSLDFQSKEIDQAYTGLKFQMSFWANAQAQQKQKKAIQYQEEGNSTFVIDLSNELIQTEFKRFSTDPVYGLAKFIWQCYENDDYEAAQ